jgi:drug/metabolite transporter (DMT)-like permease
LRWSCGAWLYALLPACYACPLLGEALALGAALTWSISVILFRRSEAISPLGLNLFKNVTGLVLLALTLLVLDIPLDATRSSADWLRLLASGVLGIGLADTLIFMALRRLGPGLLAIVDTAYAPVVVVCSVLFLHEKVGASFLLGGAGVLLGVLLASTGAPRVPAGGPSPGRGVGIALGITGIAAMAIGVVLAKPILEKGSLPEVTFIRLVGGVASQLLWIGLVPSQRTALLAFRPGPAWRTLIPAGVLGAYVSLLLWLGGLKWADASVAAVLNQMSTVFTIVLARVVLGEVLSRRKALGAGLAVAGAVVIVVLR